MDLKASLKFCKIGVAYERAESDQILFQFYQIWSQNHKIWSHSNLSGHSIRVSLRYIDEFFDRFEIPLDFRGLNYTVFEFVGNFCLQT